MYESTREIRESAGAGRQFAAAQVVSISDPNERDVCHTLELRIHECARIVPRCAAFPGLAPATVAEKDSARGSRDPFCESDRRAHFQWFSYRHDSREVVFLP